MSLDESAEFPVPDPTIVFLGGPIDGTVAEPQASNKLEAVFPDYIGIDNHDHRYWRMDEDTVPEWIVKPPQMDAFDAVYLWEPFWPSKGGDGPGMPRKPHPQYQ